MHSDLVTQHQPAFLGKVVRNSGCGREATKRESINPPAVEGFLLGGFIPTCRAQTGVKTAKKGEVNEHHLEKAISQTRQ